MPSIRKHPSLYDEQIYATMQTALTAGYVELLLITEEAARKLRMNFYNARLCLYRNAEVNPNLAKDSKQLRFLQSGKILLIARKDHNASRIRRNPTVS